MARMIGKVKKMWYGQCKRGCCYMRHSKTGVKREELKLSLSDAQAELDDINDTAHDRGMCYDPATKTYGCWKCEDLDDAYDNSDLDDIPGVWSDTDWRN